MAGNGGTVIGTTLGLLVSDPTGLSFQGHLQWATNDQSWVLFFIDSTTTTKVQTFRTATVAGTAGWAAGTTSGVFANSANHNKQGRNLGVAYKSISSTDVFHLTCGATTGSGGGTDPGGNDSTQHARAHVASGTITWDNGWATDDAGQADPGTHVFPTGSGTAIDSSNRPYDITDVCAGASIGNANSFKGTNTDAGSSWTAGFGAVTGTGMSATNTVNAQALFDTGGGTLLGLAENAAKAEPTSMTNYQWASWSGTAWGTNANVFSASLASGVDPNNAGFVARTTSDVHAIQRTGTNTYVHRRYNGSTWANGDTIPNQTSLAGGGVFLCTDGAGIWMFVIDSAAGNSIQYIRWTIGVGWDAAWTTFESSSKTRTFITGCPNVANDANHTIGVIWTQTNGSNFDIVFEGLQTTPSNTIVLRQLVGATSNASVTSLSVTWPAATYAGSCLICGMTWNASPGAFTPPTGWVQIGSTINSGGAVYAAVFLAVNAASQSGAQAFAWTTARNRVIAYMAEYPGVATVSPQDGSNATNTGLSGTTTTGTLATGNANDVLVGFLGGDSLSGDAGAAIWSSATGSFTIEAQTTVGVSLSSQIGEAFLQRIVAATGSYTAGATFAAQDSWTGILVGLKQASAVYDPSTGFPFWVQSADPPRFPWVTAAY